ncbi:hypothetical protein [Piscinibacter koreensis]|uniref:Uncharacterized protein n=1 Tax=Piscinibacter koreensis TaxID=2742824 RepID=A0A7Y6NK64_9BURK|nr:hypothetical protein [Schlegelella koreensis]NUZ04705.1 hypothetical protein [Schlegelella koreensis]
MLRLAAVALVVANVAFFAWSEGALEGIVPLRAQGDREPERLARQLRPEAVTVLPAAAALAPRCVDVGPVGLGDAPALEGAFATSVPELAWREVSGSAVTRTYRFAAVPPAAIERLRTLGSGAPLPVTACPRAAGG